jgi:hypothetical protein
MTVAAGHKKSPLHTGEGFMNDYNRVLNYFYIYGIRTFTAFFYVISN